MSEILLTCGLGDFLALDTYLRPAERYAVKTIHWATRARVPLQELVPIVFPNVENFVIVRDEWGAPFTDEFCVSGAGDLEGLAPGVLDWNAAKFVREVKSGLRRYQGSSFLKPLADISRLKLPEKFFVVHPYSSNARTPIRDLTDDEWKLTHQLLAKCNYSVVVINSGEEKYKSFPNTIDLTNQLTLLEALEVIKYAQGFVGAASVFSVMASKVLEPGSLYIKGSRDLSKNYFKFYYAPGEDSTVSSDLLKTLPKLKRLSAPREITINTVQGIGDIFWVYQKLAPHFSKINLNILCLEFDQVQTRAKAFCKMLPKVEEVTYTRVSSSAYNEAASTKYQLEDVIKAYDYFTVHGYNVLDPSELGRLSLGADGAVATYAVNAHLEAGTRIDEIDDFKIEEDINLGLPSIVQGDYLCVFVAGAKNDDVWPAKKWVKAIKELTKKLGTDEVILIGAEWDRAVQDDVKAGLTGLNVTSYTGDLDLDDSINVIRRAKFFFGYQSGLNIIADNYQVPQLMMYFKQLKKMYYTWCKRSSIKKIFFAANFEESIEEIIERVKL